MMSIEQSGGISWIFILDSISKVIPVTRLINDQMILTYEQVIDSTDFGPVKCGIEDYAIENITEEDSSLRLMLVTLDDIGLGVALLNISQKITFIEKTLIRLNSDSNITNYVPGDSKYQQI